MLTRELDEHELHGIQPVLQVADMAASIAFYRDRLGFEIDFVVGEPPRHARVSSGDREKGYAVRIRLVPLESGQRPERASCWLHVGRDLDRLFASFQAAGVEIVTEPEDQEWGLRDFSVRDPDGHLFRFVAEL